MTYYILTEPDDPKIKRQVLMRSVIKSRRKNIGENSEYVNENPSMETFTSSLSQARAIQGASPSDEVVYEETPLLVPGEKIWKSQQKRKRYGLE